ncbi:hypothetical protein [Intestinibacter bartlettii]|uniref:hypothetical protein n=1 Tax=Intestinibacter bartlettii TaxID=261299 RepID=UPI00205A4571|nr:MAG TPA: hypothetical protein [Caudoviricetes sp.]
MKLTKKLLDKKIKDYEIEANHDLTFRQWIEMLEDEFEIEHRDLDSMTDDELDNYDTFLFELRLK